MQKKYIASGAVALALMAGAIGCGSGKPSSVQNDQSVTNSQLDRYQKNQPVPSFDWSQYRQTVIDVENAEVHGVATTTFFYNMGSQKPISSCPSLGFPVAVTAQLTNPQQVINTYNNNAGVTVDQAEPNGVYTGQSSGTYVVCVSPNGSKYMTYWEGDVNTVGGPAVWNPQTEQVELTGAPTVKVNTK